MNISHTKNGDMILSSRSWFWFIMVIGLLVVNFVEGGYVMISSLVSTWTAEIYVQLPLLVIIGLFWVVRLPEKAKLSSNLRVKKLTTAFNRSGVKGLEQ